MTSKQGTGQRRPREVDERNSNSVAKVDRAEQRADVYYAQGDSLAALNSLSKNLNNASVTSKYNHRLLSYLSAPQPSDKDVKVLLSEMEQWGKDFKNKYRYPSITSRKRNRDGWITAYNRALLFLASGDTLKCIDICTHRLKGIVKAQKKAPKELATVSTRMALLFLEGVLQKSVARISGLYRKEELDIHELISWLDKEDAELKDPQFKFLLALYKSRLDFGERKNGKHVESKIRSARKEMKSAMEVFQHKLRPSIEGETASLESSDAHSEENSSPANPHQQPHQQQQQYAPLSIILQEHNQAALNLKAHLEQLKGNPKKSLILCGESLAAAKDQDPYYDAMHSNNLALVYQTNQKTYLALHSISKSIRVVMEQQHLNRTHIFRTDGTARMDPTLIVLHNTALCSLQARNYLAAYECLAICVQNSKMFSHRTRSWLRMAEACIGTYAKQKDDQTRTNFSTVQADRKPKGILIQNTTTSLELPVLILGSKEDLEQVKRSPLTRARFCLQNALQIAADTTDCDNNEIDNEALSAARLAMVYVFLELKDFRRALELSKIVLDANESSESDKICRRMGLRRVATARMYASEASCALGDPVEAMKYLVGNGQEDALDRLASELGGVTIEVASANSLGKARLARAQSMVRSSASVASAALGNLTTAKQLAMSAQAMEDAYSSSRERSNARRALVYCMLREGNSGAALTLLRSLC